MRQGAAGGGARGAGNGDMGSAKGRSHRSSRAGTAHPCLLVSWRRGEELQAPQLPHVRQRQLTFTTALEAHGRPSAPIPTQQNEGAQNPKMEIPTHSTSHRAWGLCFPHSPSVPPVCSVALSPLGWTRSLLSSFQLRPPLPTITLFRKKITVKKKASLEQGDSTASNVLRGSVSTLFSSAPQH